MSIIECTLCFADYVPWTCFHPPTRILRQMVAAKSAEMFIRKGAYWRKVSSCAVFAGVPPRRLAPTAGLALLGPGWPRLRSLRNSPRRAANSAAARCAASRHAIEPSSTLLPSFCRGVGEALALPRFATRGIQPAGLRTALCRGGGGPDAAGSAALTREPNATDTCPGRFWGGGELFLAGGAGGGRAAEDSRRTVAGTDGGDCDRWRRSCCPPVLRRGPATAADGSRPRCLGDDVATAAARPPEYRSWILDLRDLMGA